MNTTRIRSIEAHDLKLLADTGEAPTIIDVRSPAEFTSEHISGSHNIPIQLIQGHAEMLREHLSGPLVLVCQSGIRAGQAAERLAAVGIDSALILEGGVGSYAAAGGRVKRGARKWAMDRQVRMTAGSLVLSGLLGGLAQPRLRLLSAAVATGLVYSAVSDSCMMARALGAMPWNRGAEEPTIENVLARIAVRAEQ